jgi:hypothetical protein
MQKDLLELFDFIEPDDKNQDVYSYRIHARHMRAAIEVEANCKAILAEDGYAKPSDWNMEISGCWNRRTGSRTMGRPPR